MIKKAAIFSNIQENQAWSYNSHKVKGKTNIKNFYCLFYCKKYTLYASFQTTVQRFNAYVHSSRNDTLLNFLKKKEEDDKKKDSLNMNGNLLSQAQFETYWLLAEGY